MQVTKKLGSYVCIDEVNNCILKQLCTTVENLIANTTEM